MAVRMEVIAGREAVDELNEAKTEEVAMNALLKLIEHGQSYWIDNLGLSPILVLLGAIASVTNRALAYLSHRVRHHHFVYQMAC